MASTATGTNGASNGQHGAAEKSAAATSEAASKLGVKQTPMTNPPKLSSNTLEPISVRKRASYGKVQLKKLYHASRRPLPTENGDGSYSTEAVVVKKRQDIKAMRVKDLRTLVDLVKSKLSSSSTVDDKTMLMERVIQLVAKLPHGSKTRAKLTSQFIGELWGSLDHPPLLYIGEKYKYRTADGSYNNPLNPLLGAAGSIYARSVPPRFMPLGAQPDPSIVYEAVMARAPGKFRPHPNKVSSMLWYWATIIIHDLFWTDHTSPAVSKTSSYLDLSPLYGSNLAMQHSIRTFRAGRLKTDAWADPRLNGMPPGVGILLVMFNRFHNYVVENLRVINEGNRFAKPTMPYPGDEDGTGRLEGEGVDEKDAAVVAWRKYDEELFQTARLVTCGLYINITLVDYVRNIVGLNRADSTWTLDPRQEVDAGGGGGKAAKADVERGTGNAVSAEFNLCYRWHSCISERDAKWTENFYRSLGAGGKDTPAKAGAFGAAPQSAEKDAIDKDMRSSSSSSAAAPAPVPSSGGGSDLDNMGVDDMKRLMWRFAASVSPDPGQRTFGGFNRDPETGKMSDDKLVAHLTTCIEDVAGSFGARHVPRIMKPVEMLGILQGRQWDLAGLNEFREHFGLQPYKTFEDLNPDPGVASALRNLYGTPDRVELYTGLVAEDAKKPMAPGVGIAPTYTISRVVLSDAVCLVRGDRFYTTDYHPRALTSWGHSEVNYDLSINHGCVFYKLILRAFPSHFRPDSVYAHYPMVVPSETRQILRGHGRDGFFSFDAPAFIPPRVEITTYGGARHVLERQDLYKVTWHEGLRFLMGEGGAKFMLSGDSAFHAKQRQCMAAQLYKAGWREAVKRFYADESHRLLREKSYTLTPEDEAVPVAVPVAQGVARQPRTRYVDVVRDVGNMVHTHFAARMFDLPLKTASNKHGIFSEQELYSVLSAIFVCIFFDIDPVKSFPLRQAARDVAQTLGKLVEANVKDVKGFKLIPSFAPGKAAKTDPLHEYGVQMIKGLLRSGLSVQDVTWSQVLPTAGAMVPNQAEVFAQAVDFYLTNPEGMRHVRDIHNAAIAPESSESAALLLGYAMEGIRMAGTFGSYRQASGQDEIHEDDGRVVPVKDGDRVFVSFVRAARDPAHFPLPDDVNPRRPLDKYIHYGVGPHACLGREASQTALVELFRALFAKKNLRRMPGPQGELKKVPRPGGFFVYMREDWSSLWPFPCSMKVMWDED